MAKVSKEAQYLFDSFKGRFASPADAAAFLKRAKDQLYFGGKPEAFMKEADRVLGGYGVECFRSRNGRAAACYVNMGDPYVTTLMHITAPTERFLVTQWGDWLEAQEGRGNRFDGGFSGGGVYGR